jgi:hypothetical protein
MWSLNRAAGFTSAEATTANKKKKQHKATAMRLCMDPPGVEPAIKRLDSVRSETRDKA